MPTPLRELAAKLSNRAAYAPRRIPQCRHAGGASDPRGGQSVGFLHLRAIYALGTSEARLSLDSIRPIWLLTLTGVRYVPRITVVFQPAS